MFVAGNPPPSLGAGSAALAFDVGGTDIKAALVDDVGRMRDLVRVPTPLDGERTADAVITRIGELARDLLGHHPDVHPKAAGLLVPGYVDDEGGIGVFSENLGWTDYPFRDRAQGTLGVPVSFGHDVRGAGEAEYRLGAAAPFRDVVVMAIGTGIAGAIFIQGSLYTGQGLAGEMGHSKVAAGPHCACGGHGCLEAVASAGAIARRYTQATGRVVSGARDVLEQAALGDARAREIWESALDALALDLSHTIALLAPEAIVIGGGLSQAGAALFEPLERRLGAILTYQRRPKLLRASIGENAGVIGAALRARDLVDEQARVNDSGAPGAPGAPGDRGDRGDPTDPGHPGDPGDPDVRGDSGDCDRHGGSTSIPQASPMPTPTVPQAFVESIMLT